VVDRWWDHRAEALQLMRNRLRELRARDGLTQAHLANALDVSRQTVNALESGKYDPSLPLAFRISRTFRLPLDEIFFPDAT
jgi:putative transcriptional regulator